MTIQYKIEGKLVLDPEDTHKVILRWQKDTEIVSIFSGRNSRTTL
jgi:hypothetical protein